LLLFCGGCSEFIGATAIAVICVFKLSYYVQEPKLKLNSGPLLAYMHKVTSYTKQHNSDVTESQKLIVILYPVIY
jgi:hypothetical protein